MADDTIGGQKVTANDTTSREGALKEQIRDHYAERAREAAARRPATCGCGCSPSGGAAATYYGRFVRVARSMQPPGPCSGLVISHVPSCPAATRPRYSIISHSHSSSGSRRPSPIPDTHAARAGTTRHDPDWAR